MSLPNVSQLYEDYLKEPVRVKITANEANSIWVIFRGNSVSDGRFNSLKNRAFMQACLVAAIKGSEAIGWVKTLFSAAYKPTATVQGIVKKLLRYGLTNIVKADEPPQLYTSVINTIAWKHKTDFECINQGLEI